MAAARAIFDRSYSIGRPIPERPTRKTAPPDGHCPRAWEILPFQLFVETEYFPFKAWRAGLAIPTSMNWPQAGRAPLTPRRRCLPALGIGLPVATCMVRALELSRSPAGISTDFALAKRLKSLFRRAGDQNRVFDCAQAARGWRRLARPYGSQLSYWPTNSRPPGPKNCSKKQQALAARLGKSFRFNSSLKRCISLLRRGARG